MYENKHHFLQITIGNHASSRVKGTIHGLEGNLMTRADLFIWGCPTHFDLKGAIARWIQKRFSIALNQKIKGARIKNSKISEKSAKEKEDGPTNAKGYQSYFDHFQDKRIQLLQRKLVTFFNVLGGYFLRFTLSENKINTNIQNADAHTICSYKYRNHMKYIHKRRYQERQKKGKTSNSFAVIKRKKDIFYNMDGGHILPFWLLSYFFSLYAQKDKFSTSRGFTYA